MEAAEESDIHTTLSLEQYAFVYAAIHKTGIPDNKNYMTSNLATTMLTQYHLSKGLKIYGKKGENAILQELKQLHDQIVIEPKAMENMSKQDKQNALQHLMFPKQKQDGKSKD